LEIESLIKQIYKE